MKHLTIEEIDLIADRTRTNGLRSETDEHLETCEQCQREVAFQRTLKATAFRSASVQISEDFNARLFVKLGINARTPKASKFSGLLGNLFALMMVVGFFGIIVTRFGSVRSFEIGSEGTTIGKILEGWGKLFHASNLAAKDVRMIPELGVKPETQTILLSILVALFLLYVIDWLRERQSIRPKSSHHY
jgi:hypothetical protein